MRAYTEEVIVPKHKFKLDSLAEVKQCYENYLKLALPERHKPIRFVITKTDSTNYYCEIDVLVEEGQECSLPQKESIFNFATRSFEDTDKFTAVLLIPTGVGAEIGGHCGDGNAVARLIANACDILITHPNVVNASDINEMTENTLYVEGSLITRLMMGQIGLQKVRSNRVLMLMDKHKEKFFNDEIVNAVSSARITLGLDCDVYEMSNIIESISRYSSSGRAVGEVNGLHKLVEVIKSQGAEYDAIGLSTFIKVPSHFHQEYFSNNEMINPWGGIEAMLTHTIADVFDVSCAHSPMMSSSSVYEIELGIVDPRKAPESASTTYLHCILKGLHRAPRVVDSSSGLRLKDISCLIIPDGCIGLPTLACIENNIPVIAIKENRNTMKNDLKNLPFKNGKLFLVDNYLEAVGVMTSIKAGVSLGSVRRPVSATQILKEVHLDPPLHNKDSMQKVIK